MAGSSLGYTIGLPGRESERLRIINLLREGGVGVLATDTIYGLVGSALRSDTVERIYKLRYRESKKPTIVLISSLEELNLFEIKLAEDELGLLSKIWPGKVSVILSCPSDKFKYLHRDSKTLAFRLSKKDTLINILQKTGPLVAPSANPEGLAPAQSIEEARNYFGDKVDFYLDEGRIEGAPSTLVALENGKVVIKRQGAVVLE